MDINCNVDDEDEMEIQAETDLSIVETDIAVGENADANAPPSLQLARPSNQQPGQQQEVSPLVAAVTPRGRGRNRERNRGDTASLSEKMAEILDSASSLPLAATPSRENSATSATEIPPLPPATRSTGDLIEDDINDSGQHAGDNMVFLATATTQQILRSNAHDSPTRNGHRPMQEMDSASQTMSLRTPRSPGGQQRQEQADSGVNATAALPTINTHTNIGEWNSNQPEPLSSATKRPTDASAASAPPALMCATSSEQPLPVPIAYRRHLSTPEKQAMAVSPIASTSPTDSSAASSFQPGAYEVHARAFGNLPVWARRRLSQRRERQRQQHIDGRSSSIVSSIRSRLSSRSSRSRTSSRVSSSSRRPSSSMLHDSAFSSGMIMPIRRLFSAASSGHHTEHAHAHQTNNADHERYVVVDPISGQVIDDGAGHNNETNHQPLGAVGENDCGLVGRELGEHGQKDVVDTSDRAKLLIRSGMIVLLFIAAIIASAFIYRNKRNGSFNDTQPQEDDLSEATMVPTLPPAIATKFNYIRGVIERWNVTADVSNTATPQYQALQWLVTEDEYFVYNETKDISIELQRLIHQRYAVLVLFFATGGFDTWYKQLNFLSTNTSICDWQTKSPDGDGNGIWCDESGLVTRLYLGRFFMMSCCVYATKPMTSHSILFARSIWLRSCWLKWDSSIGAFNAKNT